MNATAYQNKIVAMRNLRLATMGIADDRIVSILRQAAADLTHLMESAKGESLTWANYAARRAAILKILQGMTTDISFTTRLSIRSAAERVAGTYTGIATTFAESHGYTFDFRSAFASVPVLAVQNVISRVWADGLNFSDRIWTINEYSSKAINDIITSGISRGQSAVNMSKDLRAFLVDPALTPGTTWTTAIKPSTSGRGSIHYNALRLARSEINNAYRESLALSNEANPITAGVRYNLSGSHKIKDICDVWAKLDQYGMGAGNYPADKVPLDHPNGLCYYTDIVRPANEWGEPKQTHKLRGASQAEVVSFIDVDATEVQKKAAYAQFKNMNKLFSSGNKKYRKAA
jgi:hypothetical protein